MKKSLKNILYVSSGHFVHDLFPSFLPAVTFILKEKYNLSYFEITVLIVLSKLSKIFSPLSGIIASKIGLKYFVILTPFVTSLLIGSIGLSESYSIVLLLVILSSFSAQLYHVAAPVLISKLSKNNIGRNMSFFMIGGESARTLGPIIIMGFLTVATVENMYLLSTLGFLISVILYLSLKDIRNNDLIERKEILFEEYLKLLLTKKKLLLTILGISICKGFTASTVIALFSVYLKDIGYSSFLSGSSLSIIALASIIGVGFSGTISDKIGRVKTLFLYAIFAPFSFLLLIISGNIMLPVTLFIFGLITCSITPVMMTYVQETGSRAPSFFNGIYMTLSYVFTSLIVLIMGKLSDSIGINETFLVSFILSFIGLIVILVTHKENRLEECC